MTASDTNFIEGMGMVAQADGLPRTTGRIIGLLVLEGEPYSFSELATRLEVSRASISTNTRLLEGLGVIERIGRPGDRQDYFQLTKDPYNKLMQGALHRISKAERLVADTQQALPKGAHQKRLKELRSFYSSMKLAYQKTISNIAEPE